MAFSLVYPYWILSKVINRSRFVLVLIEFPDRWLLKWTLEFSGPVSDCPLGLISPAIVSDSILWNDIGDNFWPIQHASLTGFRFHLACMRAHAF
jgi:hypothetical protein